MNNIGKYITKALLISSTLVLSSCATNKPSWENAQEMGKINEESLALITERTVRESQKLFQQQQELIARIEKIAEREQELEPVVPEFDPLETINVTINADNTDAQFVLQALAKQAGMNLLMSPNLSHLERQISLHLEDVSASLVFDRLMDMLDLHGEVNGNILVIKPFEERIFHVNFLQAIATIDFSTGGDVFGSGSSGGGGGSGGGGSGGGSGNNLRADFTLNGKSANNNDPYEQMENMLEKLIGSQQNSQKKTQGNSQTGSQQFEEIATPIYNEPKFSLNRVTGTLYVNARPSQIAAVSRIIDSYESVMSRQVLIEAQILDITLNDGFEFGVDWNSLRNNLATGFLGAGGISVSGIGTTIPGAANPGSGIIIPATSTGFPTGNNFGLAYSDGSFNTAIKLLNRYGHVRVLSNPTIRAKNSHPSMISVGSITRFVSQSEAIVNNVGGSTVTTNNVITDSVFDGIVVGVLPFIQEDGTVNLTIHPMQSEVNQASLILQDVGGSRISLPQIDFKGVTTSLSLRDGDTVLLGGLISESGHATGEKLPFVSRIPLLGNMFKNRSVATTSRELVIVLRVKVL
ncbi:MAG: pilus (MSHA type) biogenesis protein MshL [Proteobacteria bacterium]|nr:pilus (MSHA type) biogenesis protein MshL [Pseudomonadota bacterium]